MLHAVLIVAAGRGSRAMRQPGKSLTSNKASELATGQIPVRPIPKQYAHIGGQMVLMRTIRTFLKSRDIGLIQVVIHGDDRALYDAALKELFCELAAEEYAADRNVADGAQQLLPPILGGTTRQASVLNGLVALAAKAPATVLVHDAARPFVSNQLITAIISALADHNGAIAALPVTDTLKRATPDQTIEYTLDREGLWRAQTPQGFGFTALYDAHQAAAAAGLHNFTDDAAIAEWAGLRIALVEGSAANIKLTTAEDLKLADQSLSQENTNQGHKPGTQSFPPVVWPDIRVGTGYDVHRFAPGDHVWLCGIKIPFTCTLAGHSDADVGLHALTDALLGCIGDGDIGTHFPPSDPQWKGAASDQFLAHAVQLIQALGGQINNVDVTLICEAPKIGPHTAQMRERIASILSLSPSRVSIKATTTEQLGFTGRKEGIAAMATASLLLPPTSVHQCGG